MELKVIEGLTSFQKDVLGLLTFIVLCIIVFFTAVTFFGAH